MTQYRYSPDAKPVAIATTTSGQNFMCAKCRTPRLMPGRRRLRVRGVMDYVCAECAAAMPPKKAVP